MGKSKNVSVVKLARDYARLVAEIKAVEEQKERIGGRLKGLMSEGEEIEGVKLVVATLYRADEDALKASGKWSLVAVEKADARKVATLVKLDCSVLAPGGGVTAVHSPRLVVRS